ncbi:MAG: molybdopterin-guanine dinucleotide biosynthesis protein B [Pseudomonadota bacterium]
MTPVIGIVGWKNSGKTTLTVRLVEEFARRGLKVSTIKHAHHRFEIDGGTTDSARHRSAGAGEVAVVSPERWAIVGELRGQPEPDLNDVIAKLAPCDLILVEGYKSHPIPKIEARRFDAFDKRPIAECDMLVLAVAADHPVGSRHRPSFDLDDISGMADFLERTVGPFGPVSRKTTTPHGASPALAN